MATTTKSAPPPVAARAFSGLADPRAGTRLGRYELLLPLATGGMAQVWVARQTGELGFSRIVAVKTIRPDLAEDGSFRRMFLDEARVASRIRHANVVEVLDLGEDRGAVYQAMSLVEGDSLAGLLRRSLRENPKRGLPVSAVLRIVADAAHGLHAAHTLTDDDGVPLELVHRDVSPHNVLVGMDGVAKISDFGIAKALARLSDETEPGQIKGKFSYMAPEQLAREPLDCRADVFSLGVVLWEALTGTRLFRGEDAMDSVQKVLHAKIPDPRELCPALPPIVSEIALRALSRDRVQRFPTAAAMAGALESAGRHAGGIASASDVGALVARLAGPDVESMRAAVREATRSGRTTVPVTAPVEAPPASEGSAATFAPTTGKTSRPFPGRNRLLMAAFASVAIAAFGILFVRKGAGTAEAPAPPKVSSAVTASSSASTAPSAEAPPAALPSSVPAVVSPPPPPKTPGKKPPPAGGTPRPKFDNPYGR
jgi:eukaryotic-like serine/threonine-protein kinase